MHREDLMSADMLSESRCWPGGLAIFATLLVVVVAAPTQTATLTQRYYARKKR